MTDSTKIWKKFRVSGHWPFALGFFHRARIVVAWCEEREDFRHFRTDRITRLKATEKRFPRRRRALLKEWRAAQGIAETA